MIATTRNIAEANVITHSGLFHADEVFGTVILSKILDNVTVLRTSKVPDDIGDNTIVYDVGFGKFDHHQKGGNGVRKNGVPYASAGLLWREFGPKIVSNTPDPKLVWNLIDIELIQGIDAVDNGALTVVDSNPTVMSLPRIISSFNPRWNTNEDADTAFLEAVKLAETVFDNALAIAISKAEAQTLVEKAIEHSNGHIMVLDRYMPWQGALFNSKNPKAEEIFFVIFPSNREGFNWQCVPEVSGGFVHRKPVPTEWRGLNDKELQAVTGINTAIFCHKSGFIGGAETLEDAIALAKIAIAS